jgi:hypothetical protein
MRLISFDIGIKNMAYCIFDINTTGDNSVSILNWEVLNLLFEESSSSIQIETYSCSEKIKKGKETTPCKGSAKYKKGDLYFCTKHAKICRFLLPNKNYSEISLKKKKVDELQQIARSHSVTFPEGSLKKNMIDTLKTFFEEKSLDPIIAKKMKSAGDTDLICIGRNMKRMLDMIPNIEEITHVIIENQISPIANRMKTLQGMLTQYFIMRGSSTVHIEFISSANKLKGFDLPKPENNNANCENNTTDEKKNSKYKQHKKDGIHICSQFLEINTEWNKWKEMFLSKTFASKKDDLADSFLQGIWYLKNKKIIVYAENLKINSMLLT